jgi:hypothetical protein
MREGGEMFQRSREAVLGFLGSTVFVLMGLHLWRADGSVNCHRSQSLAQFCSIYKIAYRFALPAVWHLNVRTMVLICSVASLTNILHYWLAEVGEKRTTSDLLLIQFTNWHIKVYRNKCTHSGLAARKHIAITRNFWLMLLREIIPVLQLKSCETVKCAVWTKFRVLNAKVGGTRSYHRVVRGWYCIA